jgi:hypothetical protein
VSISINGAKSLKWREVDISISWVRQRDRREPAAVFGGRQPEASIEGSAECIVAPKADGGSDRVDLGARPGQVVTSGIESQCLNPLAWGLTKGLQESSAELTRTEGRTRRELLDR